MENTHSRIAKNTLYLYIRMGINMLIGLYTSRLTIQILGITSFGVYGAIIAITTFLWFIHGSLYSTANRFIAYETGRNDVDRLRKTYGSAQFLYAILAILIFIAEETVGLYYLHNKAVIPPEIADTASIAFHLCVLAFMFQILRTPAENMVLAHERMDTFAGINITENVLKLILLLMLANININNAHLLVPYSAIFVFLYFVSFALFNIFVIREYAPQCKCSLIPQTDKTILCEMLKFFVADIYTAVCVTAKTNGISLLQNLFFGPAANASALAAGQVQAGLASLTDNFLAAINPQLTKQYADGNNKEVNFLIFWGIELAALLYMIIAVPFYIEADFLIRLWLVTPPPYVSIFLKIVIITLFFEILLKPISHTIMATGKIKRFSFYYGTMAILSFVLSALSYKLGFPVQSSYICVLVCTLIASTAIVLLARIQIPLFNINAFMKLTGKIFFQMFLIILPVVVIYNSMPEGWARLISVCAAGTALCIAVFFTISFDKNMRLAIRQKIQHKIKSFF